MKIPTCPKHGVKLRHGYPGRTLFCPECRRDAMVGEKMADVFRKYGVKP